MNTDPDLNNNKSDVADVRGFLSRNFPRRFGTTELDDLCRTAVNDGYAAVPDKSLSRDEWLKKLRLIAKRDAYDRLRERDKHAPLGEDESDMAGGASTRVNVSPAAIAPIPDTLQAREDLIVAILREFNAECEATRRPSARASLEPLRKMNAGHKELIERQLRGQTNAMIAQEMKRGVGQVYLMRDEYKTWFRIRTEKKDPAGTILGSLNVAVRAGHFDRQRAVAESAGMNRRGTTEIMRWAIAQLGVFCPGLERLTQFTENPADFPDLQFHLEYCELCQNRISDADFVCPSA